MELLRALATIRNPLLDQVVAAVTMFGEETFFMIMGLCIFWCINKTWGYRFMIIGLSGTAVNQLLKAIFLVPRPWILDPSFTIVEAAREQASGYSFPSGHTQSAATVFGTLAAWASKTWVTVACILLILAVGFSRMYLGVHTPQDVGVSLLTGAATVFLFIQLFRRAENNRRIKIAIGLGTLGLMLVFLLYVTFAPVTERNIAEFDIHAVENAWKLLGTTCGMLLAWWIDDRYTHFDTKAVWWAQVLKVVLGAALVVGVKSGLKPVFTSLFGNAMFPHFLRYFLMVAIGAILWPMSFRYFGKLGQVK